MQKHVAAWKPWVESALLASGADVTTLEARRYHSTCAAVDSWTLPDLAAADGLRFAGAVAFLASLGLGRCATKPREKLR